MGFGLIPASIQQPYTASNRTRFDVQLDGTAGKGAQGAVTVATVSGIVTVRAIVPYLYTPFTGAGASVALGITGSTSLFIGATAVNNQLDGVNTRHIWLSTAGATVAGIALPATCKDIAIETNILMTVTAADITAGEMFFDVAWDAIYPGATLS